MTVRVVVDSTADMPSERARELGITVVPLAVSFGDETYLDGVNLNGDEFYRKLAKSPVLPKTATPSPGVFDETYRKLIAEGATGILSIHIASKLSGTYSVARQAATPITEETGVPIEAIDSNSVSCGFGLPAEILAREAREGADLQALKAHGESLCRRTHLIAVLDTLEFLQRGGRIGRAQAILGTALKFKPLLEVRDGQVLPLERVRTLSKALDRHGATDRKRRPARSPLDLWQRRQHSRPDQRGGADDLEWPNRDVLAGSGRGDPRWAGRGRHRCNRARIASATGYTA